MINNFPTVATPRVATLSEELNAHPLLTQVSEAEANLLKRFRACQCPTLFMVHVGGDGEPKTMFAWDDVKREDLARG